MKLRLSFLMAFGLIFASMQAAVHNVAVASFSFTPSSLAINVGDTVVWTNTGGSHNVNGTLATFPNNPVGFGNAVGTGWTYQFVFQVPGTYNYQCDPHSVQMQGSIVVSAPPAVPCSKPFISEYIEGSSNNKGFEIYNPTGSSLDLGPYKVYLSGNGGNFTNEFDLEGNLASGDVYVITTDQADPQMLAEADTALSFPSVAHYNGDDALFLVDTASNDTIDIIGVIGVDPGSSWTVGTGSTQDFTLVRKSSIDMGQTDWSIGANEWDVYPQNTYTYLGSHTSGCVAPPVVACSRPFFSEYIEGSSNNKGFEIYNPTNASLDLAPYKVYLSGNGGTFVNEFDVTGSIASGDVYVITTNQSDPTMLAQADTALSFPSVAHYNGDDALFLVDTTTNDTVDIIGVVGVDPGSSWTVGTGSTQDHTLIRTVSVESGQTDWSIGATEWDVHPQNTFSFLGSHSSTCVVPAMPTVDFAAASRTYLESAGTVTFDILINPASSSSENIDLQFTLGAGLDLNDGTITPTPDLATGLLSLPVGANEDTVSITFSIIDDAVMEGNETLFVDVVGLSAGLDSGSVVSAMIIIEDNDAPPPPVYNIADVKFVDANNEPDSLGVECSIYGVVYTDDFDDNAGYSFYIYDNTGGINVFNFADVSGYQVQRGDSIKVTGEIDFFRGLIELFADSIEVISSGHTLKAPTVVSVLDESTEGEYIRMNGWTFVDVTQWTTGSGSGGFNVDITNGTDTLVMRIDAATDLYTMAAPTTGTFDVIGAGSQYDDSSPYDEGYQIFPRDSADIITNISLTEIPRINVSLYPNPAHDVVYIQSEDNMPKNIQVFNMTGQMVRSLESTDTKVAVSLKGLPVGSYMVAIEVDGRRASYKVILK